MQKLVNILAVTSFVVSTTIVIAGVVIYDQRENIVEGIKTQVIDGVSEVVPDMVSSAFSGLNMGTELASPEPLTNIPF